MPNDLRLWLVRHGETTANVDKRVYETVADHAVPLTERGIHQAKAAGEFLGRRLGSGHRSRVTIWRSPYHRARQTEGEVSRAMHDAWAKRGAGGVIVRKEHLLLAEQQFGLFDGVPDEELAQRFPDEHAHYEKCQAHGGRFWARLPLGESRFDLCQRVHQAFGTWQRDLRQHESRDLVVVAHGSVIRAIVMMWCHLPWEWFEQEPNPANGSVRLIDFGTDRGVVFTGDDA